MEGNKVVVEVRRWRELEQLGEDAEVDALGC